jgi:hypothetical protein
MKKLLHSKYCYGNYMPCVNEPFNVCGSITMLMIVMIMALAVSGGLYLGTIAFSAYQSSELDKAIAFIQSGFINLA